MEDGAVREAEARGGGRVGAEVRAARRNKRRDWVRKGGVLFLSYLLLLPIFVLVGVTAVKFDEGTGSPLEPWLWLGATLILFVSTVVWIRVARPLAILPERYAAVTERALAKAWVETDAPERDPFNRRLVAGQLGDSHRVIAYYAPAPIVAAPAVFVHGVSKHPSEDQLRHEPRKRRIAEIVYVVWTAPLSPPITRAVVAAPADDPDSPLEPFDSQARRFESNQFNGAYRVLSNDPRVAHAVFDPALLDALLQLRHRRVRVLWEEDIAYVACELDVLDDELWDRVPWLLGRMQRNAALTV